MNKKVFPWRLFTRIVLVQAVLVLAALTASGLIARYVFRTQFVNQVEKQLHTTLEILARNLPGQGKVGQSWCIDNSDRDLLRVTVIGIDGKVLCDSSQEPAKMENHGLRPEFLDAVKFGFGHSERVSSTMHEQMLYAALKARDGSVVIRAAMPLPLLIKTLRYFDASLALFLVLIAIVISGFAAWSARTLVFPIGRLVAKAQAVLNEDEQVESAVVDEEPYGELSDLESSLESIRRDIETKAERLNTQREEQATLMGAISDSILAVDLEGSPLFYNSRFAVLFGRDELREKNVRLWEMFREPEILGAFRASLKDGRPSLVAGIPLENKGVKKFFSISVSPLRRANGDVYGSVGIFHDVTELKLAEQIRIDFVANVSHELRTPLTAIKGYADTLALDVDQGRPVAKEFIDIIIRNTSRLMSLINDLLDLSSLDSNADEMHKILISTDDVTTRVLSQLHGTFEKKKQIVKLSAGASSVYADPRRLEQVLVNLLDNASKYTPTEGKITINWELDDRSVVILKISDSGPGIPREHHSRLFERFYRVDKARSRELGGTGLGLAIVKHIMQRHGGAISVESTLGNGATFICRFPNQTLA